MRSRLQYEALAVLFEYPTSEYPARVRAARELLRQRYPCAADYLRLFAESLPSRRDSLPADALAEVQEIFTRSFDVQSITTLSVGYVVFGDDYKRGELLVNLNREHRDAGVECGSELSDHLPNVLRLLARWNDEELVAEFVQEVLRPAVESMIAEFGPERMEQRNRLYEKHFKTLIASSRERGTMFRQPLAALSAVLNADFAPAPNERPRQQHDFLGSIVRELTIEETGGKPARSRSTP